MADIYTTETHLSIVASRWTGIAGTVHKLSCALRAGVRTEASAGVVLLLAGWTRVHALAVAVGVVGFLIGAGR